MRFLRPPGNRVRYIRLRVPVERRKHGRSYMADSLVRRATSYMFNLMKTDLDVFFEAHCHHFAGGDEEHKLVYTSLYKEYEELVESKMEGFTKDEGYSSSRALYKEIQEAVGASPRSALYLNVLLAAADYEKFVKLMTLRAGRRRLETKYEEGPGTDEAAERSSSDSDDGEDRERAARMAKYKRIAGIKTSEGGGAEGAGAQYQHK